MKNWKTTIAGILALATTLYKLIVLQQPLEADDMAQLSLGAGLLGAKDFNVTGGTKQQ